MALHISKKARGIPLAAQDLPGYREVRPPVRFALQAPPVDPIKTNPGDVFSKHFSSPSKKARTGNPRGLVPARVEGPDKAEAVKDATQRALALAAAAKALPPPPVRRDPRIGFDICGTPSIDQIINIYKENSASFCAIDLSTAIHRIATLYKKAPTPLSEEQLGVLKSLTKHVIDRMDEFHEQSISNTAWAYATLGIKHDALFEAMSKQALKHMKRFTAQGVANTTWAYAKLGFKDLPLFGAFAHQAKISITTLSGQHVSNIAWAFATVGIKDEQLFQLLSSHAIAILDSLTTQSVNSIAWAFATLGIQNKELFDALASRTIRLCHTLSAVGVFNIVWAFATLEIENKHLFHALAMRSSAIIQYFSPVLLAIVSWGFAKMGVCNKSLFDLIATRSLSLINSFNQQNLANLSNAFATLKIRRLDLFRSIKDRTQTLFAELNEQNATLILWAFAALGIKETSLFESAQHLPLMAYSSRHLSQLAWSHAELGIKNNALFLALENRIDTSFESFQLRDLANIAYALAMLEAPLLPKVMKLIGNRLARDESLGTLNRDDVFQLYQAHLCLKYEFPTQYQSSKFPREVLNTIMDKLSSFDERPPSSQLHLDVSKTLRSLELPVRDEVAIFNKCIYLDSYFEFKGHQVAVEVDGPTHFTHTGEQLGHDHLRDRLITKGKNFSILRISYRTWDRHAGDKEKKDFLIGELARLGVVIS